MKILVIPDIHENLDFLKYIFAVEDTASFDHIVLLGDYFDAHGEANPSAAKLQQVAGTLLGYKELYGERLHRAPQPDHQPMAGEHHLRARGDHQ